jgi:transcriptional regulator with XRE-family HTH domain
MADSKKTAKVSQGNSGSIDNVLLRTLREKANMTQKELAGKLNMSYQAIARLEQSPHPAMTDTLTRLAGFFGVSCGYLLGEEQVDLERLSLNKQLAANVEKFLQKVFSEPQPPDKLLEKLLMYVDVAGKESAGRSEDSIEMEEEIMGVWWDIVNEYRRANWQVMTAKASQLIDMAQKIRRPYLAGLGRAYKAYGLRNQNTPESLAQAAHELTKLQGEKGFECALKHRITGKIYSRRDDLPSALAEYLAAEELVRKSTRDDVLFILEKVKLLRNIAGIYERLADSMGTEQTKDKKAYLKKCEKYLAECGTAIEQLAECGQEDAFVENAMLCHGWARYHRQNGDQDQAIKKAIEARNNAEKAKMRDYDVRLVMLLFNFNMRWQNFAVAAKWYGQLLPLQRYRRGPIARHYKKLVAEYETEILNYIAQGADDGFTA